MKLPLNKTATWEAIYAERAQMAKIDEERPWHLHGGWTPFVELPLAQRVAAVDKLCLEIAAQCPQFEAEGIFYIDTDARDDRPQEIWTHRNAYAIGSEPGAIWNFQMATANFEARCLAHDMAGLLFEHHIANDGERAQMKNELKAFMKKFSSKKSDLDFMLPDKGFERFDGLSRYEIVELLVGELLRRMPPPVYEEVVIKSGYEYGTGVTCCVDTPFFTDDVVLATIRRFRENGERGWRSAAPIASERLTQESEHEQLTRLARNGWPKRHKVPERSLPPVLKDFLDNFFADRA